MTLDPLVGLALGFAGGLHCIGMCGPIAISLPRSTHLPHRQAIHRLLYQAGRVLSYTMLGAIVGTGGTIVTIAGYGRMLSIAAGVLILFVAIRKLLGRELPVTILPSRAIAAVKSKIRSLLTHHGAMAHIGIGVLNGFLPCGLVTVALIAAIGTGSVWKAALFMTFFGLGTVPLMAVLSIWGAGLSCTMRHRLRFAAPAMAVLVGILFLVRGAALGIPYLSPAAPTPLAPASCCAP